MVILSVMPPGSADASRLSTLSGAVTRVIFLFLMCSMSMACRQRTAGVEDGGRFNAGHGAPHAGTSTGNRT